MESPALEHAECVWRVLRPTQETVIGVKYGEWGRDKYGTARTQVDAVEVRMPSGGLPSPRQHPTSLHPASSPLLMLLPQRCLKAAPRLATCASLRE